MPVHCNRPLPLALAAAALASAAGFAGQATPAPAYATRFYRHAGLRLESYLYLPAAAGPVPLVVYNHGSRVGGERDERPYTWVATLLTAAGYAVLVPERRGYGKSEGQTFSEEVGFDRGPAFVGRLTAETSDALAAVDDVLAAGTRIDRRRLAILGWSFGGIVSVLGGAQDARFAAVVAQAPAALTWDQSPALREALLEAAGRLRAPVQCLVAENDATTDSARQICARASAAGAAASFKLYPPFTPPTVPPNIAPGHGLFGPDGVTLWKDDVLGFLADAFRTRGGD